MGKGVQLLRVFTVSYTNATNAQIILCICALTRVFAAHTLCECFKLYRYSELTLLSTLIWANYVRIWHMGPSLMLQINTFSLSSPKIDIYYYAKQGPTSGRASACLHVRLSLLMKSSLISNNRLSRSKNIVLA